MDPGETATGFAYASWSLTLCFFISGIIFGSFISSMLLNWKSLLSSKFRALLGYQDSDSHNIQDEALSEEGSRLSQEDSASLHSLDSNMSQGSSLSQQEDSAYAHPPPESKSIITEGSSSSPRVYICDVYLSFRGVDTSRSFIDYLHHRLLEERIRSFRGEGISSALRQEIKDSRMSMVVFSRGYASSTWCLDDLVAIADCHKEMKQEVLPVFYDVDPDDVRDQKGPYEDAFVSHENRFKEEPEKIYKWKSAMTYLANLSGLTLTDQPKGEGIERIVEKVFDILSDKFRRTSWSTDENRESTKRRPTLQELNIYHVFLSLRPTHTHSTFIYYLYHYLTKSGFSTFKSDAEIQKGESIPSRVLQAIKCSRMFIVVFTRDYADSISSLEEMATIFDRHRVRRENIIPVFFDVDPRDVRSQTGPYEKAFVSYTEEFKQDPLKVQRWRAAMKHMTNINGFLLKDHQQEIEVIENIIQQMDRSFLTRTKHLSHHLAKLLKLKDNCVLILGIWGMAGSGKTICALELYDIIFQAFQVACFIEVSRVYRIGGAAAVQKKILSQTSNNELSDVYSPLEISGLVRKRLSRERVLIVFDNVDELMHLKDSAINPLMLGEGSRIIITTRNRQVLNAYGVDESYQIPVGREPYFEIMEGHLQTSFEGLEQDEKEIFLHIACFFHGKRRHYVNEVLNCCGFFAEIGIQALLDKSLITIQNEEIHMHSVLQDLGKKIVQEEDPKDPGLRSRLWLYEELSIALNSTMKRSKLKAIVLYEYEGTSSSSSSSKHEYLKIEGLSKMRNLELLILYDQHFTGILPSLPHRLRYLLWDGYPFISLPSFEPYNRLVQLNLPNSRIRRLWNGRQNFPSLERVDLSYSTELKETPDFGGSPRLKRLDFTGCTNVQRVHPSIGLLKELAYLSFRSCYELVTLNLDDECKLSSLRVLDLYSCTNLKDTPDFTGLPNLERIDLGECASLSTVHYSIGNLKKLEFLKVPASINLPELGDVTIIQTPAVPSHGEKVQFLLDSDIIERVARQT